MPQFEVSNDRLDKLYNLTHEETQPPLPPTTTSETRRLTRSRSRSRSRERKHRRHRDKDSSKDGPGKFRFKKKRTRDEDDDLGRTSRHRKRDERSGAPSPAPHTLPSRHRHGRSKSKDRDRDYIKPRDDYVDDETMENSARLPSPETAFRESLFDAMADDEGAAFWEGVYGQPIHVYARPAKGGEPTPKGDLEMMNDDEYAEYVRSKMWEKSHEHIIEERRRREEDKAKRKAREEADRVEWEKAEKERIRKEKSRRDKKARDKLRGRWDEYKAGWVAALAAGGKGDGAKIPWPVESGKIEDVDKKGIERFFELVVPEPELLDALKTERIRWHPDKIQQKLGKLNKEILEKAIAVFQTVDDMWNNTRK